MPFFVIQDPVNFDVLALFDKSGDVVEQYVWDPYGNVLRAEPDGWNDPRPILNRVGHHGLFFDRLDQPVVLAESMNLPVLDAGAYAVGHVRNRTYWPNLGRWGQRDPNAVGLSVRGEDEFEARTYYVPKPDVDIEVLHGDGSNLFAYCRSAPANGTDPHGLDFMLVGQIMMMAIGAWDDAEGKMYEALQGVTISVALGTSLQDYASMQEADVDWATDWSTNDDWFSSAAQAASASGGITGDEPIQGGLSNRKPSRAIREARARSRAYPSMFSSREFNSKKEAREAAQSLCAPGQKPAHHPGHRRGELPHYQPVDAKGRIIPGPHFRYPKNQR